MKKCPFCGAELSDDSIFCTECGKEFPKGIVCPRCGASINEGVAFCSECGCKIPQGNVCSHCGAPVSNDDVFCKNCGKRIDDIPSTEEEPTITQKKCPHCGASVIEGDVFCADCGKKIDGAVQVTESKPVKQETTPVEEVENNLVVGEYEEQTNSLKQYLPYIIGGFVVLALAIGYFVWNNSKSEGTTQQISVTDTLNTDSVSSSSQDIIIERVKSIYDDSGKQAPNGESYWLTAELNSLIKEDREVTPTGDIGCIDYDIWSLSQDEGYSSIDVNSTEILSDIKAIANITLKYPNYSPKVLKLILKHERGDWFIDDFITDFEGKESSFKQDLIDCIKSTKENQLLQEETDSVSSAYVDSESNDCYYVYGTRKELESMSIISNNSINTKSLNKTYFTEIGNDVRKEIKLYSKNATVLSNHPSSSYELGKDSNGNYKLNIIDPNSFWSNTKFLVIVVD